MISSLLFDLSRPLTTKVHSTISNTTADKVVWPITSGQVVFQATAYRNMTLVVYRPEEDKSYLFTSDGYDWIPLQS